MVFKVEIAKTKWIEFVCASTIFHGPEMGGFVMKVHFII